MEKIVNVVVVFTKMTFQFFDVIFNLKKKIIKLFWVIVFFIKRILKLVDAYFVLFLINLGSKGIQTLIFYNKIDSWGLWILIPMTIYSLIFHYFLIFLYDHIKKDLFEIENKEKNREKGVKVKSLLITFLKKVGFFLNKLNWFEKLTFWVKNFGHSVHNTYWFEGIIFWVNKLYLSIDRINLLNRLIKGLVSFFILLSTTIIPVSSVDPMLVVILLRKVNSLWNGIPNGVIFFYFLISCFICELTLFLLLSGARLII
jgi:hypothetical protein